MAAFDKAWKLAKEIKETLDFVPTEQWETKKAEEEPPEHDDPLESWMDDAAEDKLGTALRSARRQKRKPLPKNLGGMVRTEGKPIDPFGGSGSFRTDKKDMRDTRKYSLSPGQRLLFDPDAPPNQNTSFHSDDESKIREYEEAFALGDQETMDRLNAENDG